jgi:hypothetical protein
MALAPMSPLSAFTYLEALCFAGYSGLSGPMQIIPCALVVMKTYNNGGPHSNPSYPHPPSTTKLQSTSF